jgi:transcriptional regulator with XRE-family HTH domain
MLLNEALAVVVRGMRKSRGLSQEDFKSIDRSYLARIEAGRANPSLNVLQDIAKTLNIEVTLLVALAAGLQANEAPGEWCLGLARRCNELTDAGIFTSIDEAAASPRSTTGRTKKGDPAQIAADAKKLRADGLSLSEIAHALGLSKTTIHRYLAT